MVQQQSIYEENKMPGMTARRDRMRGDPKKFLRPGDEAIYSKGSKKKGKKAKAKKGYYCLIKEAVIPSMLKKAVSGKRKQRQNPLRMLKK